MSLIPPMDRNRWLLRGIREIGCATCCVSLPESQRDVIELRLIGLTNDEIGRVIGKRSGAVRMLVHRAFETLRPMLQEQGFDYER